MRVTIVTKEQNRKFETTVDIIRTLPPRGNRCYIHHELLETKIGRNDEHLTVGLSNLTLEAPREYQLEVLRHPCDLFDSPMLIQNAEAAASWFCWGTALFGVLYVGVYIDSTNRVVTLRVLRDAKVDVTYSEEEQRNEIHHQK